MSFQLVGLDPQPFAFLFDLTDQDLARRNMVRVRADAKPGYPCRVSLTDADIGDELLLLPFTHLSAASPYSASGPIFVAKAARQASLDAGVVPDYVQLRQISVRGYDANSLSGSCPGPPSPCSGPPEGLTTEKGWGNERVLSRAFRGLVR